MTKLIINQVLITGYKQHKLNQRQNLLTKYLSSCVLQYLHKEKQSTLEISHIITSHDDCMKTCTYGMIIALTITFLPIAKEKQHVLYTAVTKNWVL